MTAKEYLLKIQTYRKAMIRTEQTIEELYASAGGLKGITYDSDKVQTTPENHMEIAFARIDMERRKLADQSVKYAEAVRVRIERIAALDNPTYSEVLSLRYIDLERGGRLKTFDKIGRKMGYSEIQVKRLHGKALEAFRKKYRFQR